MESQQRQKLWLNLGSGQFSKGTREGIVLEPWEKNRDSDMGAKKFMLGKGVSLSSV